MIIPCSEKCLYQEEGLCTLTHITVSSSTPLEDCPYYHEQDTKKGTKKNSPF